VQVEKISDPGPAQARFDGASVVVPVHNEAESLGAVLLVLAIAGIDLSLLTVPIVVLACAWLTTILAMVGFAASRTVREISGRPYYLVRETLPARRREVGSE
jgi:hypothetical protein